MRRALAKFIFFTIFGWKIDVPYPKEVRKSVVIPMPHTSNWDFPIGIIIRPIMGINISFAAKDSLFFFPLNLLM